MLSKVIAISILSLGLFSIYNLIKVTVSNVEQSMYKYYLIIFKVDTFSVSVILCCLFSLALTLSIVFRYS